MIAPSGSNADSETTHFAGFPRLFHCKFMGNGLFVCLATTKTGFKTRLTSWGPGVFVRFLALVCVTIMLDCIENVVWALMIEHLHQWCSYCPLYEMPLVDCEN